MQLEVVIKNILPNKWAYFIRVYFGAILIKIWYDQDHKKVSKFAVTKWKNTAHVT